MRRSAPGRPSRDASKTGPRPASSRASPRVRTWASHPLKVEVSCGVPSVRHAARLLARVAQHVARAEGFRRGDLSVAVVGARRMSRLHERYRGDAGPTDVLTFDLGTDRRRAWIEGEIVVCAAAAVSPVFSQRAARARPAAAAELALYVAHGVLHLAGFEDETPGGFRRMHRREAALLADLPGLPAALLRGGGPVE